jgi:tol-pal system protein YbgF
MKSKVFLTAVIVLCVGSLPLLAVKKDTKMILDEIQKLADTLASLNEKVDAMAADLAGLAKKSNISDERIGAMSRNQADMAQNREDLMLNMQFFKEELNDIKNSLSKINDRISNIPAAAGGGTAGAADSTAGGTRTVEPAISQDPSSMYYAAYSDYIKENFDLAIEGFRQFIRNFPESGLADNSLYWIGECYYAKKKYQDAINTFNELLNKYRDGDKAPAAILKKGYALLEMGRQSEGIAILKDLISRFPLSEESSLAQQKIKEFSE